MHKLLFVLAVCAIAGFAIGTVASCGATSPCQDLLYKLCDCETDKKTKDACYSETDKQTFSAEQDTECSKYKDSCTCQNYKTEEAKTKCGGLAGG